MNKKLIYIVSGLPRSGTSMMMRILEAGGIPVLSDNIRKADIDNPGGYYELEKVKTIREDSSWLNEAVGKVFKMVSMLLLYLPEEYKYKVVFMERQIDEILVSEQKMLKRLGKERGASDDEMRMLFGKHLKHVKSWLSEQDHIEVLFVSYNEMLQHPESIIQILPEFSGITMNTEAMVKVVDPSLYRNRKS
ncbi:sulfotransferase domain-containing protein [bacterium]|nr:sulfotransferase domain-containing protein [bacterium]